MADRMAAARAARAAKAAERRGGLPAVKPAQQAKGGGGGGWLVAIIIIALVLVLLAVALAVVQQNTQAAGASVGLVPIKTTGRVIVLRPNKAYVTPQTLERLYKAAEGDFPPLKVLDASAPQGGPLAPHKSHQKGVDVDLRTGSEVSLTQLQNMVNSFKAVGAVVASSRQGIVGAEPWDGHMDHTHVRFP